LGQLDKSVGELLPSRTPLFFVAWTDPWIAQACMPGCKHRTPFFVSSTHPWIAQPWMPGCKRRIRLHTHPWMAGRLHEHGCLDGPTHGLHKHGCLEANHLDVNAEPDRWMKRHWM
jgi:hypothetical protein